MSGCGGMSTSIKVDMSKNYQKIQKKMWGGCGVGCRGYYHNKNLFLFSVLTLTPRGTYAVVVIV